ncbi:MAG TPA: hypothetical protein VME47_06550 [Acetobacteraceae bacterium]|nr:hypothetical protein [Acetobacteraceae bacterium]
MRRTGLGLLFAGAVLLLIGLLLSVLSGASAMPSYLADWLFWSSLPLGALPVVMLLDLAGPGAGFGLEPALRGLLWLTPLAGLLLIPVLVRPAELFGWASGHGFAAPFGQDWMTHGAFIARSIIYFVLWSFLALLFVEPPTPAAVHRRRGFAAIGLFIYALSATLAAIDWVMAVEPGWSSPEIGILVVTAQATIAVSAAVLLAGGTWRSAAPEAAAAFLLIVAAAWIFTQFMQFLVIWSADKPTDITWYLHRDNAFARAAAGVGFVAGFVLPVLLLLSPRNRRRPRVLPAMAVLLLCVQVLDMLWLITPSVRHHFTISFMDVLELAGIGGIVVGGCLARDPARYRNVEATHA